jgi:putative ATP-dependent endonuclease of the OLD family
MKITHLHIENFRSIKSLDLTLDDTTVFIGPNNAGKSAIIEAVRIALSRRWGQQGTGFTENDVHRPDEKTDPRTAPAVKIGIILNEPSSSHWPGDMVADLEDVMTVMPNGLNRIALNVNYSWNKDSKSFEPTWEFLNAEGNVLHGRRRSINTSPFFNYLLFFWLGPLRDADDEFTARSRHWGGLLRSIQIPAELEAEVKGTLDALDVKLLNADPKFGQISKTVGRATEIASGEKPGAAKLRMLPLDIPDLMSRAGIVLRNEEARPWLPLDHHGQGLQSLSVIFLFQAAVMQKLSEELEGAEAVFAIEEPEVHLHPQAARTLWTRIADLPGQKLVTTHSPHFVQNVPLHNLRIVRFRGGSTQVAFLPTRVISDLPWTQQVENLVKGRNLDQFTKGSISGCIISNRPFDEGIANDLVSCCRKDPAAASTKEKVDKFRYACRILVSEPEEVELSFLGRRVRGEIFFAREWILVEGPSEFLLLHAIARALGYELDQHGVSVVDFQNNGNASIYPALADAFDIPWQMATDGDAESKRFQAQLAKRGYGAADLKDRFFTLPTPNDLEDQLLADGHEALLRQILVEIGIGQAEKCSHEDLKRILKNKKTAYMARLAPLVGADEKLASQMPKLFVAIVKGLKDKYDGKHI